MVILKELEQVGIWKNIYRDFGYSFMKIIKIMVKYVKLTINILENV